ncbi:GH3 family domain-containing protein [Urbifossiella limnaea]|uniref:GH3 auxin-responsive promoter n=1 Tax=Urbifossiella limnaea TaxID=2528023 RepID=A0A517XYK2_9BACT|nr:GH3 auxin-responsive promoter family protein [Urbifossiella limnaea]QDU22610.1 GH3 auxin-responsive promoter [Urbifossiella limnaea]
MPRTSFLAPLADSRLVRRAADAGFVRYAHARAAYLDRVDAGRLQRATLMSLVRRARDTRFGRDHDFGRITSVADFQARVPVRGYEFFWDTYWKPTFPRLDDVTWPGRLPYYALSSGTTSGATKYVPVSREMLASNRKAARTTAALFRHSRPEARTLTGKIFFLGGTTDLRPLSDGSRAGDLSGIAFREVTDVVRPYVFPPPPLAALTDWDEKLTRAAALSVRERITTVSGVPAWLLTLFDRVKEATGASTVAEAWPALRLVVHGGTSFDPYRALFRREIGDDRVSFCEVYACSEGFVAAEDPRHGLLRVVPDHDVFFEFVPVDQLAQPYPERHTLATVEPGVPYAVVLTTCAGLWAYLLGDTVAFESRNPPLLRFTGRTKFFLSAFGEHLIQEEVERAVAAAARAAAADVPEYHVGPEFPPDPRTPGRHLYLVEFAGAAADAARFAADIDAELSRLNEDYAAHRAGDLTMRVPRVAAVRRGGFAAWMKSRGAFGGQHKVPRMDNTGARTAELAEWFAREGWLL